MSGATMIAIPDALLASGPVMYIRIPSWVSTRPTGAWVAAASGWPAEQHSDDAIFSEIGSTEFYIFFLSKNQKVKFEKVKPVPTD
jgi:hypothetical protein